MVFYSQVIYLDKRRTKKIRAIQNNLFKLTGSRACLDIWEPHLTIGDGIDLNINEEKAFHKELKNITSNFRSFEVEVKGFGFMDDWKKGKSMKSTPFVIYLDVLVNPELQTLAENIRDVSAKFNLWYKQPWPYNPHITIAFKDLTREGFIKAKKLLENEEFYGKFIVKSISIAKENNRENWEKVKDFYLKD